MLRAKHKLKIDVDSRIFSSSGLRQGWCTPGACTRRAVREAKDPAAPWGRELGRGAQRQGPSLFSPAQSHGDALKFYCWKSKLKRIIFTGWV